MKPKRTENPPRAAEVWNASVPFDGDCRSKIRPVCVMGRDGETYDVFPSTTHPAGAKEVMRPSDPYLAGLNSASHIKTDRIVRLPVSAFIDLIGELGDDDAEMLRARYRELRKK